MRSLAWIAPLTVCSFFSGCALCPPGYLDDYAATGSKWQRGNVTTGRVGSILSDPGSTPAEGAEFYYEESPSGYSGDGHLGDSEADLRFDDSEDVFPAETPESPSIVEPEIGSDDVLDLDDF